MIGASAQAAIVRRRTCFYLHQHLLDESQRAGITRLSEPEERLFPHLRIRVVARNFDQPGTPSSFGSCESAENRSLLDLRIRVFLDGLGDRRSGLLSCLLREPEQSLPADVR